MKIQSQIWKNVSAKYISIKGLKRLVLRICKEQLKLNSEEINDPI